MATGEKQRRTGPQLAAHDASSEVFAPSNSQNAPAAAAVFMAVVLAGAGFLWLAVSAPTEGPTDNQGLENSALIPAEMVEGEATRTLSAPAPTTVGNALAAADEEERGSDEAATQPNADANGAADADAIDAIGELLKSAEADSAVEAEPGAGLAERNVEGSWGVAPNLKPNAKPGAIATPTSAAPSTPEETVIIAAPALMRAADAQLADDFMTPFFFPQDIDVTRRRAMPLAVELAGDVREAPREITVSLSKGETFVDALKRAGVNAADRNAAAYAFGEHQNLRTLRPGQSFQLTTAPRYATLFQEISSGETEIKLLSLEFRPDTESKIKLVRTGDAAFAGSKEALSLTTRLMAVQGRIDGSLYASAKAQGAPDKVIADLANMFAYDVDFQREVFGGDEYEAIFEVKYDAYGNLVGAGEILYGRLNWRGRKKEKGYYRFARQDERTDYFDADGEGAKRLLMKTPIDGARLSSGFGNRKHPILGYARAHKGVDFAASRGTPIKAAGDGVIERADRFGSFGNYIRIRHANGYKTAYAHLNGFAKGIRAGKRVDQGDIIGYVGTTGRSTGPHLHYEVHLNGQAVNPQNLKIATGVKLNGSELTEFRHVRDTINQMRLPPPTEANAGDTTGRKEAASAL